MPQWRVDERSGAERARRIEWLVLDVDGVLTDGKLYYGPRQGAQGETKAFHVHDGHGLVLWQRAGKQTAVISGRSSEAVTARCADLNIAHVYQGALVKKEAFETFLRDTGAKAEAVCYIGDDIVDVPILRRAGLAVAVANAMPEAVAAAQAVTDTRGGCGAVREVIDYILKVQQLWTRVAARYDE